jgi:hypothetical protein
MAPGAKNVARMMISQPERERVALPAPDPIRGGILAVHQLIDIEQKTLDPGFRGGDVYRVFRPDVGISILFHHPVRPTDLRLEVPLQPRAELIRVGGRGVRYLLA